MVDHPSAAAARPNRGGTRGASSTRLSAYEHLPRPQRGNRAPKYTATSGRPSSDVSSSLVSPSNVINAVPRPKSPRAPRPLPYRPDYSAAQFDAAATKRVVVINERQSTEKTSNLRTEYFRSTSAPVKRRTRTPIQRPSTPEPPLLAATHFQSAVMKEPRVAHVAATGGGAHRKEQESNWQSTDVTISGDSTTCSSSSTTQSSSPSRKGTPRRKQHQQSREQTPSPQPRRSPSPRQQSRSRSPGVRRSRSPVSTSPARARRRRRNIPPVRSRDSSGTLLRGCIQGGLYGGAMVGRKFTECVYLSADVYQAECGPHQDRGDDHMFLFRKKRSYDDGDDIMEDDPSSFYSGDRSKMTIGSETTESRARSGKTTTSGRRSTTPERELDSKSPASTPDTVDELSPTPYRSNRRKEEEEDFDRTPTRRTYNRHRDSFDVAPHAIHYDQGEMPRLHARNKTPWEESLPDATNEFVELRNLRLSMFQQGSASFEQDQNTKLQQPSSPQSEKNAAQQSSSPQRQQQVKHQQESGKAPGTDAVSLQSPPQVSRVAQHKRNVSLDAPVSEPQGPSFPPWRRAPEPPSINRSHLDEALRLELEETKKSLAKARTELKLAQEVVVHQKTITQTKTTQLTSEKIEMESKLKEEARAKEALLQRIGRLQEETAELKSNLQHLQKEGTQRSPNRKPPLSPLAGARQTSPSRNNGSLTTPAWTQNFSPHGTKSRFSLSQRVRSPDVALADTDEELSPASSRDDGDKVTPDGNISQAIAKTRFDSGAVLNLVREIRGGSCYNPGPCDTEPEVPPKTTSPVSVMDFETSEKDSPKFHTPPRKETPHQQEGDHMSQRDDSPLQEAGDPTQTPSHSPPQEEGGSGSPFLSSRLIEIRSELLEVRSQLAEANAARIKAETRRAEVEDINREIQLETKKLREEVKELKQLVQTLRRREDETEAKHRSKIDEISKELVETKTKVVEGSKTVGKLEEELTETHNEADELRGQVVRFMKELERTKKESEEKIQVSDSEAKRLQEELRQMKEKLSATNSEIVQQAAEHLRKRQEVEAELEQTRETSTALRKRVLAMDDQLSRAETESEILKKQQATLVEQDQKRTFSLSPPSGSWKKSFAGMAESFSRTISDSVVDDLPIIIPDAPPKESRSSVINRLRQTLDSKQTK